MIGNPNNYRRKAFAVAQREAEERHMRDLAATARRRRREITGETITATISGGSISFEAGKGS